MARYILLQPFEPHDAAAFVANRGCLQPHPPAAAADGPYLHIDGEAATMLDRISAQALHRGARFFAI